MNAKKWNEQQSEKQVKETIETLYNLHDKIITEYEPDTIIKNYLGAIYQAVQIIDRSSAEIKFYKKELDKEKFESATLRTDLKQQQMYLDFRYISNQPKGKI